MSGVNWGLGAQQGPDIGQRFIQGLEYGRANSRRMATENALRAYAANPADPGAANALLAADPAMGMQLRNQQIQQRRLDQTAQREALESRREDIERGAQIIRQVQPRDEATWQTALQAARSLGIDLDGVPTQWGPEAQQYATQLVTIAASAETARPQQPTELQRNVDYYRSIGRDDLADQYLNNRADPLVQMDIDGDGMADIAPRSAVTARIQGAPAPASGAVPRVTNQQQYDALAPGAEYTAPDGSLRRKGGASPSNGSQTFP